MTQINGIDSYRDTGVVFGIEGSDPSYAVAEVVFFGGFVEVVRVPVRHLDGLGPLVIGSTLQADFEHDEDKNPTPVGLSYMTDEEVDHILDRRIDEIWSI